MVEGMANEAKNFCMLLQLFERDGDSWINHLRGSHPPDLW